MISRDDRIPLFRLISASLDSVSPSILRFQPTYMFLRLTFRSSFASWRSFLLSWRMAWDRTALCAFSVSSLSRSQMRWRYH